jgi:hypothetical protein
MTYGTAPTIETDSHASATNSIDSRAPSSWSFETRSRANPIVTAIAIEIRKTSVSPP